MFYVEKYYNELKSKYWTELTAAQRKGLNDKVNAFQVRVRAKEAGTPYEPITTLPPKQITVTTPGEKAPVATEDVFGVKKEGNLLVTPIGNIDMKYVIAGGIILSLLFVIPAILPEPKKTTRRKR